MQGETVEEQALIHTSYFRSGSNESRNAIVQAVNGESISSQQNEGESDVAVPVDPRVANPTLYGYLTWLSRGFATILIACLPWLLVLLLAYAVFDPHSRWYYLTHLAGG